MLKITELKLPIHSDLKMREIEYLAIQSFEV